MHRKLEPPVGAQARAVTRAAPSTVIRGSRRGLLWQFLFSAVFTAVGVEMVASGDLTGIVVLVFVFPAVMFGWWLVRPPTLELTERGMRVSGIGGGSGPGAGFYPWEAVSPFTHADLGGVRSVLFDLDPTYPHPVLRRRHRLRSWSKATYGHDSALTEIYGLDAADLAAVLNEWRDRAILGAAGSNRPVAGDEPELEGSLDES
jgi:hypothetical protein